MIGPDYLAGVDPDLWPEIACPPEQGRLNNVKARKAEAAFGTACEKASLDLDGEDPDLVVLREELFGRLAQRGWLGLAEGYMAEEWTSDRLVPVLSALIASGFDPLSRLHRLIPKKDNAFAKEAGGELPPELVQLYSGDGVSGFGGLFESGVRTTERVSVPSYVRGAGRRHEPKTHFVDITEVLAPGPVERADLGDAQRRAADSLLDIARVGQGSDVLELPSASAAVALQVTHLGGTVDLLTTTREQHDLVDEFVTINGASSMARPHRVSTPIPSPNEWRGNYDCLLSVEKLETLPAGNRVQLVKAMDRMMSIGGFFAVQTVVATPHFGVISRQATEVLQHYVWPALKYPSVTDVHRTFDRHSNLRITSELHFGAHYQETLRLQRELFDAHSREAAAAGFDQVFRRLWTYRFALLEALFRLGCLDAVQFGGTSRNRHGRR